MQVPGELFIREPVNHLVQESPRDQTLGAAIIDAAALQVEQLLRLNLAGGRTVSATDIIRENLQSRHRISLSIITQEQISDFLVRIGSMRSRLHLDQPGENCARL